MAEIVCITNSTPNIRSCVSKDKHVEGCTGERRGKPCMGCLPRPAQHGLLCWSCWENLVLTLNRWPEFAALISGIDRAVQRDTGGVRSSSAARIPIPATRLSVDECESFLSTYKGNADEWVSRVNGATEAVQFTKAAESAFRSHPTEELPHRVKQTRCLKCSQNSLVWIPPAYLGDNVRVTCNNTECGYELDQSSFEMVAAIEEKNSA